MRMRRNSACLRSNLLREGYGSDMQSSAKLGFNLNISDKKHSTEQAAKRPSGAQTACYRNFARTEQVGQDGGHDQHDSGAVPRLL